MQLMTFKKKKPMIITLAILCVFGIIVLLFVNQASFGKLPQGKRLERIKQSPNYNGKQFVNEIKTSMMTSENGSLAVWKEYLFGDKSLTTPDTAMSAIKTDLKSLPRDKDWIVWFGHSSYLLNLSGKTVLVDPVFRKASPVSFVNKMFKGTDIYKPTDMPDIDYLVISHDHWDHLDYETVKELEPRVKRVVIGLGVGEHFEYWGYPVEKLVELDWWDVSEQSNGFRITATPARHFSGRSLFMDKTLWASYVFESPKRTIWIGGDTGYGPHFAKIGQKFPGIDLAILENGQYDKNWADIHTQPEQLSKEMTELNAARYMTVHHSKLCLSNHPYFEPLENAKKAAKESGKPMLMPTIGEVVYLD